MQLFVVFKLCILSHLVNHQLAHLFLSLGKLSIFHFNKLLGFKCALLVFFTESLKLLLFGSHLLGLSGEEISASLPFSFDKLLITRGF